MKNELDENGLIKITPRNVYLIRDVNYTEYKNIYEWECLAESEQAYKFEDKISERVFWIERDKIKSASFGQNGYFVLECIYNKKEETGRLLKQLTKK